jgi:predicted aspartyl protease
MGWSRRLLLLAPMVLLVAVAAFLATSRRGLAPLRSVNPLAERWRRVADAPEDPLAWMKLAEVQTELDQGAAAERSLWTAIELGEPSGLAHGRLGFLMYAQGRDEDARALLEAASEIGAPLPLIDHTLAMLDAREAKREESPLEPRPDAAARGASPPSPPEPPPPATADAGVAPVSDAGRPPEPEPEPEDDTDVCTVELDRVDGGGTYALEARFGDTDARLILDTGASLTVVTAQLADDIGLWPDREMTITAITANGRVVMPTAVVPGVEVAGRLVEELRVAICDDCVDDIADGLLGLDLQASLRMQVDTGAGQIRFGDCPPP